MTSARARNKAPVSPPGHVPALGALAPSIPTELVIEGRKPRRRPESVEELTRRLVLLVSQAPQGMDYRELRTLMNLPSPELALPLSDALRSGLIVRKKSGESFAQCVYLSAVRASHGAARAQLPRRAAVAKADWPSPAEAGGASAPSTESKALGVEVPTTLLRRIDALVRDEQWGSRTAFVRAILLAGVEALEAGRRRRAPMGKLP